MRLVRSSITASVVVLLCTFFVTARAQQVSQGVAVSKTFVIDAIDHSTRVVTLRDAAGNVERILCGPEVQRFDALKVGDKVTFQYYESMVYQIAKPGTTPAAAQSGIVRKPGDRPAAAIAQQQTAVVTINAIDAKVPSVTVTSADGRKMSFKVQDAANLQGVKVGDKVEITYTQALAVSVAPGAK